MSRYRHPAAFLAGLLAAFLAGHLLNRQEPAAAQAPGEGSGLGVPRRSVRRLHPGE
jgi:hypothetical protein